VRVGRRTGDGPREGPVRGRMLQKANEFVRKEARFVLPAAKRAATHGIQAFFKKFSEEYAKERKKP
jgi:hypothetical protein